MRFETTAGRFGSRALALAVLFAAACQQSAPPAAPESAPTPARRPVVKATSFPADWLVARIGGDDVTHMNVSPVGQDPPHWQPPAETVVRLAEADLIIANGAGYEKWMELVTLPRRKIVSTAAGLDLIEVVGTSHSHAGAGDQHSHEGIDPHTWMDPDQYNAQAEVVTAALSRLDPAHGADYRARGDALARELTALAESWSSVLDRAAELSLAASHPAYNYLARRFGLTLQSFDLDPAAAPDTTQLAAFEAWSARTAGRILLLWEAEPADVVKAALPARVEHVVVDPLEQPPPGGRYDYLEQAEAAIAALDALLAGG